MAAERTVDAYVAALPDGQRENAPKGPSTAAQALRYSHLSEGSDLWRVAPLLDLSRGGAYVVAMGGGFA